MRNVIFFLILFIFITFNLYSQNPEKIFYGQITFQNSDSTPAVGVSVSGFLGTATTVYTSKDGKFHLIFPSKYEGDKIKLTLGTKDIEDTEIEIVNDKELDLLKLPRNPMEEVRIVVCKKGDRDIAAQKYYDILVKSANKTCDKQLNRIENEIKNNNKTVKQENSNLEKEKRKLQRERDKAINEAEDLAFYMASIDLDQANMLVKQAFKMIEKEDLEEALHLLNNRLMDRAYMNAIEQIKKGEEEIQQLITAYKLKVSLLENNYLHLEDFYKTIHSFNQVTLEVKTDYQLIDITNNKNTAYIQQDKIKETKELPIKFEQMEIDTTNYIACRNQAIIHAFQNQIEPALFHLQKAVDLGYDDLRFILEDESLESIRKEEKFLELVKELKKKLTEGKLKEAKQNE